MKKTFIATTTALMSVTAMTPTQIFAKDTLTSLQDNVDTARKVLDTLVEQKAKFEDENSNTLTAIENLTNEFDMAEKDALVKATGLFLDEHNKKLETIAEYEGYESNLTEEKTNVAKEISRLDSEKMMAQADLEDAQKEQKEAKEALDKFLEENKEVKEALDKLNTYTDGLKAFTAYIDEEFEFEDGYKNYSEEDLAKIIEAYKNLPEEEKKPLSLQALLTEPEGKEDGEALTAVFKIKEEETKDTVEENTEIEVVFVKVEAFDGDPEDLVSKYDEYIAKKAEYQKVIDETEDYKTKIDIVSIADAKVEELKTKIEGIEADKKVQIDKRDLLGNLTTKINELKDTLASDEEVAEAQFIHDTLASATTTTLISEDGYEIIKDVKGEFGDRYNTLIEQGKELYAKNEYFLYIYEEYIKSINAINGQIETAEEVLQKAKDELEAYKVQMGLIDEINSREEKTEDKETAPDGEAGNKATGIGGMSIALPVGIGVAGLGCVAITNGLKRKKKHRN